LKKGRKPELKNYYNTGNNYLNDKNYNKALLEFINILDIDPGNEKLSGA